MFPRPNAHVGQNQTGFCPTSEPCSEKGSPTLIGIDTPAPNTSTTLIGTLPTGQTASTNISVTAVGTAGEFYVTFTPKCAVIVLGLYLDPSCADNVDVVEILVGNKNAANLLGHGRTSGYCQGRLFSDLSCCAPLIQARADQANPVILHGWTRGQVASQTIRGSLIAKVV